MKLSQPSKADSSNARTRARLFRAFLSVVFCFAQFQPVAAQQADQVSSRTQVIPSLPVPRLVKYGGTVNDSAGAPRSGVVGLTFSVYKDQTGGATLWMETHNVELDEQGRYTVLLGSTKSEGMPLDLFASGDPRWLGIKVELPGENEQPRVLLVSVPYALKASDADTLGGKPASAYALAQADSTAGVPANDGPSAPATKKAALAPAVSNNITGSGTTNQVAKFTGNNAIGNSAITETGGNVGIGTSAPGQKLDVSGGSIRTNSQFISTAATGTAPLVISSQTMVTNLNAALLGGITAGGFAKLNSANTFTGTITAPSFSGSGIALINVNAATLGGSAPSAFAKLAASNVFTGSITASSFVGNGSSLTNVNAASLGGIAANGYARLNASNIFTGSITASSFSGNGTGLTNVNAASLGGTAASGFAKLNASNIFTGSITASSFSGDGSALSNVNATSLGGTAASGFAKLNASNVFAGSVSAPVFIGDGSGLVNVNAASVSGVPAGAIATTSGANTFTGNQTVSGNLAIVGIGKTLNVGGPATFVMDVPPAPGYPASVSANCVASATTNCTGFEFDGLAGNTILQATIDGTQKVHIDDAGNTTLAGQLTASGAALPSAGDATAAAGLSSGALGLTASAYDSSAAAAVPETFQWQAQPVGNNTSSPSGQLDLLFGSGASAPSPTGLSIGANGLITFAPGQTFPGGTGVTSVTTPASSGLTVSPSTGDVTLSLLTSCAAGQILKWQGSAWACDNDQTGGGGTGTVTSVGSGLGLFGGPITTSGTLAIDPTVVPLLGAAGNTFAGSITASSFSGNGSGLTGVNASTLNGTPATGYALIAAPNAFTADQSISANNSTQALSVSQSGSGAAAILDNTVGGNILIGEVNGVPKFGVDGQGNVIPTSFATLGTDAGTILHRLAKPTVPGNINEIASLTVLSTSDTSGSLGIVVAKEPPNVTLAYFGRPQCDFDGPTTAGDYITISSILPGGCHDAGATYPTSGQLIGRTLFNEVSAGTYEIALFPPEERAGSGSSGGTITAVNTPAGGGLMGGTTSGAADLSLTNTCAPNQVLQWDGSSWVCATIAGGGGGSVTTVNTGLGLTGGPITSTGTVAIDTTVVPRLGVTNSFTTSQNIAGNLTLTGSATVSGLGGSFTGTGGGVLGRDTGTTGATVGVEGISDSPAGRGVVGIATAATDPVSGQASNIGVLGTAAGNNAAAVFAHATSTTGLTNGLRAISDSTSGIGALGQSTATTGSTVGVEGDNSSTSGTAVYGNSLATSGFTMALHGVVRSPSANALVLDNVAATQGGSLILGNYNATREFSVNIFGDGFFNGLGQFNGSVGIGTAPIPGLPKLTVVGDIRVGTSGTNGCIQNFAGTGILGTCSSDRRLKKNIQPFSPILDKVAQLQPVTFEWRADEHPEYGFGPARNSGLIAQDVEKIFPDMVATDARGFKMVNYSELPYLMLQAIKELKSENDGLKQQNAMLAEALANQQKDLREVHTELRRLAATQPSTQTAAARPATQQTEKQDVKDR